MPHLRSNLIGRKPALGRLISIALAVLLFTASVPPVVAVSLTREAAERSWAAFQGASSRATGWLGVFKRRGRGKKGTQQGPPTSTGVRPQPPPTKAQREARVISLRINPKGDVTLQAGQSMLLSAIPLDIQGDAIQGLASEWETSDKEIVSITKTGDAVAGKPGHVVLTAVAGRVTQTTQVTVIERTQDFDARKPDSTRHKGAGKQSTSQLKVTNPLASTDRAGEKRHHAGNAFPARVLPLRALTDDPLPSDETSSLYGAGNAVGSPPGKKKPGAITPPVATQGTEDGNQNFSFALPVAGLSGRGLGVSLSLVYNSQVWNKSIAPGDSSTWMTYDVDSGWPGPGFRLGFGEIEDQGSGTGFTLSDPDGTRHALVGSGSNYDTTDGTFIHYDASSHKLYYPDGTIVEYGASGGEFRQYPIKITDRNGNYITITYAGTSGAGPQIDYIQDTLNRYVHFYYDSTNGDLVTITAPGLTGALQVMRFYYDDVTIPSSGLFGSGVNVSDDTPSTVRTLTHVYLPASSDGGSPQYTGYKFDYSAYGMIYQTTQFRGMTVSSTSTSSAGTVTSDGTEAAHTTYDYPTTGATLTDVPTYSNRTDEWAGRTSGGSAPSYAFTNNQSTGVSTVTAPDGTITETHAIVNPGNYDDGLISDNYVEYGSTPTMLSHTHMDWQQDGSGLNARVFKISSTDVPAGLTKATVLSYTTYNNVTLVSERDFTTDGSVSTSELRKTETTYIDSSPYLGRHLMHLPETVKIEPHGSTIPVAEVHYDYDVYGSSHGNMTPRTDIIRHDGAFDPFGGSYVSATDYRGNVTKVTTYEDAPGGTGAITHETTYDIAGNVTSAQVDCCQSKTITYWGGESGGNLEYVYPKEIKSGNPSGINVTTSATFDYDTGLPATATDENGQVTQYSYNSASLRLSLVEYPDGGQTSYGYSDGIGVYAYVVTGTKLDSSHTVDSYRFLDGRGAVARTFNNYTSANGFVTQDIEYDAMGRAYRASNPYYSSGAGASINPDGYWTTSAFDHLGRVYQVTMPTGDNSTSSTTTVSTSFDGVYTTVTDQAGKTRRQQVDAMGRVIRLDEPTSSGLGSTSSPNQPTGYEYDLLDNLVHITQGSQDRYFKYDSLSRLIREKQVEQETNSSYDLSDAWNSSSAWTRQIDYNPSGLVTEADDARGIRTQFSYDDLNRVTLIEYKNWDNSAQGTPTAHYYYDGNLPSGAPSYTATNTQGRLTAMTYGSGTPVTGNYFAYDVMGRAVTQKQVTGSTTYGLSYTYNYAGLLATENYPSTRALAYAYDEGGRLSGVSDGTTNFAGTFSYEAHGGLASETFGNTMVHALEYNRRLQANKVKLSQTVSSTTTVLQQYDYGYGEFNASTGGIDTSKNNGQIGKIIGSINGTAQWNQGFSYDELGRLSSVAEHTGSTMTTSSYSQGYTYDKYGNRFQAANTTLGLQAVASTEINASTNRFINSGSTPTTYDAAGNITTDTKFRSLKYEYDANGRQSAVKLSADDSSVQTSVYDCAGQRVQTTEGIETRTMVYDVFGQDVAEYLGGSGGVLERENVYRGGQLLAVAEAATAAAPAGLTAAPGSSNVALSWSAVSGAANYRIERKAAGGSYTYLSATSAISTTDLGTLGSAYLYRVCAADGSNNCTSPYSNAVLGARLNFSTDATITSMLDDPTGATVTYVKAAHITELRTAIGAVRSLAGLSSYSYTHSSISSGDYIYKEDVSDLRTALNQALSALGLRSSTWVDDPLTSGSSGTLIRGIHVTQLRACSTSGSSCYKPVEQFVKDFYQGVLQRQPTTGTSSELSTATATLATAQAQGSSQLLTAAQSLGSALFGSSEYSGLGRTDEQFISDLYTGYLQRLPDQGGAAYWLGVLHTPNTRATLIAAFAAAGEFSGNVAALCPAPSAAAGTYYVLSDVQGSARALVDNQGTSSAVVSRHDYLPFGEELGAGTESRSGSQGYGASDTNRWKYGMLQRDSTGLDHTWWRKYESFSGRWTSPDQLSGGIGDPQSFNHYTYAGNDPVNFIDPSGLDYTSHPYHSGPPNSMFSDYMIDAWRQGWNQMYGLNPVSITFESDHGRDNDATWTAYTTITLGYGYPQNSFDSGPQGWHAGVSWTKCPPVQFKITGIAPNQAPGTTAISQTTRADIPDGGVAIKPGNFGVKGVNGNNRSVFLNMKFEVDWTTATPANAPAGIPTQGPFFPVDNIGPASVRNSPGNQIDVYNYQKYDDALASTRTAMVTTWIPSNTAGVKCPE